MKSPKPLLIVLLILIPLFASARTSVGILKGVVVDSHGSAIAGATVTIQTSDGQHPHATRTDTQGHFEFARFQTGQYDLRAYSQGSYSPWVKRVAIRSSKPAEIKLQISLAKH